MLEAQNTVSQARFYIKKLGGDFDEYEAEHRTYNASLLQVRQSLEELVGLQIIDRKFLPNFMFAPDDIVVAVGQDGLVANTLKYLDGQPLIGINPDAARWDGVLLPFKPQDARKIIEETIAGRRKTADVSMARARIQNGQELLAVNDFFIGQKTHTSARYVIKYNGLKENQSSSGVIVSTGLGSTGWMKSVIAGASRLSESVIGRPYGATQEQEGLTKLDEEVLAQEMCDMEIATAAPMEAEFSREERVTRHIALKESSPNQANRQRKQKLSFSSMAERKKSFGPSELSGVVGKWSSSELLFAVREPFPSKTTGTNLIFGTVSKRTPLRIESLMGENGVIFSDGIENDFIVFNSGTEAEITLAAKQGKLVI